MNKFDRLQELLCQKYKAEYLEPELEKMVGVADNIGTRGIPLNGLRHPVTKTTTGWYIWAGKTLPSDPGFFKPMHLKHLIESHPELLPYLGLAPGWRFLIDPSQNYEDVWQDSKLLIKN